MLGLDLAFNHLKCDKSGIKDFLEKISFVRDMVLQLVC